MSNRDVRLEHQESRIENAEPRKFSMRSSKMLQNHTLGKKKKNPKLRSTWRSVLENGSGLYVAEETSKGLSDQSHGLLVLSPLG